MLVLFVGDVGYQGQLSENGLDALENPVLTDYAAEVANPSIAPGKKLTPDMEAIVLRLRRNRKLGARRIQNELIRNFDLSLSLATIHKILACNNVKPLKPFRRKKGYKRYQRPIPGERVQMDTMKVALGLYQYTAIDDCSRFRVLGLYKRRTAANTLLFIERVIEEMPFPIQRIQTDRGFEFFAIKVQKYLLAQSIKFRPIKPGRPHLNGKVERSQKTDLSEFYSNVDLSSPELEDQLDEWQSFYNWNRPHGSLKGQSPMEKVCDRLEGTPYWEDVYENYDSNKESIQERNYYWELKLRKLKRSM